MTLVSSHDVRLVHDARGVRVEGATYGWTWNPGDDTFRLTDGRGRPVVSGPLQPAVVVAAVGAAVGGSASDPMFVLGLVRDVHVADDRLRVTYAGAGEGDETTVGWRFEAERCWIEPVTFTTPRQVAVVSLHYFARPPSDAPSAASTPDPGLSCRYLIHPGVSGSGVVSPVIQTQARLDLTTWLGRGGGGRVGLRQQWGLPVHYIAGVDSAVHPVEVGALTTHRGDAFCLGLADLPAGDLLLRQRDERFSPVVEVRGDLWGHLTGPGTFELGATMVLVLGADPAGAIRAYQRSLVDAGIVAVKESTPAKAAATTAAQFNTWGAQITAGVASERFSQAGLDAIHAQVVESGLDVETFVVDDKWEGEYGKLEHSAERFPQFAETLETIRAHGGRLGLWAAFLRCDDPQSHGLTSDDMLSQVDGTPVRMGPQHAPYHLFDVTRPGVRAVLRERIAAFVATYRPAVVKFDFGYEIPDLSSCAPSDLGYAGERLLRLALDVVVGALREADPDIVVMYYSLSPLFADHVDLHSIDDPWMNVQDYHAEINRRLFFSGLLGELGVPSYGSGGYDWVDQVDIWFDSVVFGPLGALSGFTGDQSGSVFTRAHAATYNGLSALSRRTTRFSVEAIGASDLGPVSGARSSSWARIEDGQVSVLVVRVEPFFGAPGVRGYDGLLSTEVSLAVGSLDAGGLARARRVGIVPRGDGVAILRFVRPGEPVGVTVHTLEGARLESHHEAGEDGLRLTMTTQVAGVPVTWVELVRG